MDRKRIISNALNHKVAGNQNWNKEIEKEIKNLAKNTNSDKFIKLWYKDCDELRAVSVKEFIKELWNKLMLSSVDNNCKIKLQVDDSTTIEEKDQE